MSLLCLLNNIPQLVGSTLVTLIADSWSFLARNLVIDLEQKNNNNEKKFDTFLDKFIHLLDLL